MQDLLGVAVKMADDTPLSAGYSVLIENASGDYKIMYSVFSVTYEDANIILTDVPTFEVETDNITGRNINKYSIGKGCKIYRDGLLKFYGIIEPREFEKSSSGSTMKFGGMHRGYKHLQDQVCDYYRADNNEYAAVVNPWRFGRKTDEIDNTLIDGLRPDEIMQCLIGTKFIWQEWFDNHNFLRFYGEYPRTGYMIGESGAQSIYNNKWESQTFKVSDTVKITSIDVRVAKFQSPGALIIEVRDTTTGGEPSTTIITDTTVSEDDIPHVSGYGEGWTNIKFETPGTIQADVQYALMLHCTSGSGDITNFHSWYRDPSSPEYSDGTRWYSNLWGQSDSWNSITADYMFKVYGTRPDEPLVVYDGVLKLPKQATSSTADVYALLGTAESIGLYNGDKHVDVMGTITTVTAKLVGAKYSTYNPSLYVCRNADAIAPVWNILTLSYDGDSVWTGTTNIAEDGASPANQFGYIVSINSDGTGTTEIDYARFDCVTVSDTSITAGTIDSYNDPNTSDDTVAINLAGMTRLEALEKVRTLTSVGTVYADVNWDAYVNNTLDFYFTTVRGSDIDKTFSFDNKNLSLLGQKYDGEIKNTLIALGAGEEPYAVTLVGTELQDATSIATYGQRIGYFIDKSILDAPTLFKRTKAYLKYMKDPRESLSVNICNDPAMSWDVGDRIKISDTELGVSDYYRVLSRKITKGQDADEQVKVELGNKANTLGSVFRNIQDRFGNQEIITQGTGAPAHTLAAGLVFDTTRAAEYPFYVPKDARKIIISAETHKYRAYLTTGIWESTYYPAGVCLRMDGSTNTVIQSFGYIGTESTSAEVVDLDITGSLRDVSGKLVTGVHTLYFCSQPSTSNTDGLGIVSVSHRITVNTAEDISLEPLP